MDLITLSQKFNTHKKCVEHLTWVRWGDNIICPHCDGSGITPREINKNSARKTQHRNVPQYHCNGCNKDFSVLTKTIFESSKMAMNKWYLLIALLLDAKKGMSSMQLSRSLKISYRTAWFCAMKVRCSMLAQEKLLSGTVEMDATYIGGRPKYRYNPANPKAPIMKGLRGKGTKKIPVVAMVERGGRVVFKVMEATPNQKTMVQMLKHYGDMENIQMMTDDGSEFKAFKKIVPQQTVNHSQYEYVRDEVHTNTVEGLFGLVKSSIKGQYHSLSKKYLPFYLSEFAYKYNVRSKKMDFLAILRQAVSVVKQVVRYKPVRDTMQIAYGR